ncbi:small ribosomal subunit protein uS9m-like isoform X2 [Clavelina lepadiformis]|uniref:small ribosomal subunit protein uS9m-like isoform X2 n=1 Tax=Clavelina lepadiformis TaxID=159417 RepID=UPI0040422B88
MLYLVTPLNFFLDSRCYHKRVTLYLCNFAMWNHCLKCFALRNINSLNADIQVQLRQCLLAPVTMVNKPISLVIERYISTSQHLHRKIRLMTVDRDNVNLQLKKQVRYSEDYIQHKIDEHNLGVRRLAAMMGEDPDSFTNEDVKKAIQYLFPSSLTAKPARPQMEHPSVVFPAKIKLQANKEGRPHHYLFYTRQPALYGLMHEAYDCILDLHSYADKMRKMGQRPPKPLDLGLTHWLSKEDIEKEVLSSKISDDLYNQFITQIERLVEEPYSEKYKDFIMKFRRKLVQRELSTGTLEKEVGKDGREFVRCQGFRKTARADVKLIANGSGKITINGKPMQEFFNIIADRETVVTPFIFLGILLRFDVEATVDGGFQGNWMMLHGKQYFHDGTRKSAMAGAIRYGISSAIRLFISPEQIEIMRRAGLLTRDLRVRERKKPGKRGARRSPTWKKR